MKRVHVFNPVSGSGHSPSVIENGPAANDIIHVTDSVGDAEKYIYDYCLENPETHFIVYGGDGTINEAVNGILKAGAGDKALLTVVPAGTGNDFVRTFKTKGEIRTIDAMKYNDRYAINIVNFGFDSNVVARTNTYKKVIPGSPAYIMGVADTLFRKMGENWEITTVDENGNEEQLNGTFTLALVGNCKYYGGGFCAASLAEPDDGLLDFVAVGEVSRMTFISLVKYYKNGTHLDANTLTPSEKFKKYITFKRVKHIKINNIKNICADGEIESTDSVEISVVPKAIRILT